MPSYAAVESALAQLHGASPEVQRGALRGRIKHLQRLGLPLGNRPKKGPGNDYTDPQIWQLALALELAQCGIDPTTIVRLISENWENHLEGHLIETTVTPRNQGDKIMVLSVGFMSRTWEDPDQNLDGIKFLTWVKPNSLDLRTQSGEKRRAITINVSDMMRELKKGLEQTEE